MKKLLSIILSLLTASTMLAAVNQLSFTPNVTITPGGIATITVMMDNQDEVAGFQFEMLLPEGLSVVTNAKGKMEFKLNADRIDDHVVTSNLRKNGKISVMSYSATAEPYYGTSGQILSFAVKADESYTGTHAIEISDINISSCLGVKVNEITTASIEVKAPSDNPVVATSISLDKLYAVVMEGESAAFVATVEPLDVTMNDVEWSTSDTTIATVDQNGNVTGLKKGVALITATTKDGTNLTAQGVVIVDKKVEDVLEGDIDHDGVIDIAGVTELILKVLSK